MLPNNALEQLTEILQNTHAKQHILQWHQASKFKYLNSLIDVIAELKFHPELYTEKKLELLTNPEYLLTYEIRKRGLSNLPTDWMLPSGEIDHKALDVLWLKPEKGHLGKIKGSQKNTYAEKRGVYKSDDERLAARLEKLQTSIQEKKIAILLGRHTNKYKNLQNKLNLKYEHKYNFISDHLWSSAGYTERGMKISNNRLSLIQACETVRRLPELGLKGEAERSHIRFSLDDYDVKVGLSAIYSNPNYIARSKKRPIIESLEKLQFSYTGLTDLELSMIVRNRMWYELTSFCRTNEDGDVEELTKEQAKKEYGIKCIVPLLAKHDM